MDYSELKELDFSSFNGDDTIPHDVRSRIKTKDYFFFDNFSHVVKLGRRAEF